MAEGRRAAEEFPWTDQAMATLRRLWAEGLPASAIGRQLGTSKHAVIGKAQRMKLPSRESPIRRGRRLTAWEKRRAALDSARPAAPAVPLPLESKPALALPAAPSGAADAAIPPPAPAGTPRVCQWLSGDGPFRESDKCGRPARPGRPYCDDHCARAYRRVGESEA